MSLREQLEYAINVKLVGAPYLRVQRWRDERALRGRRPRADDPLNPPLVSTARMKELMSLHYLKGRYANGTGKVAWVTSGAPVEILRALDFYLVYPENHAALCGARKQAEALEVEAENAGYSRDICSYARTDIGSVLSGRTPVGKVPKPDLLVACTNICQTVLYWYRVLADQFNVPLFVVDTPFLYQDAFEHQVDFVKGQLEEMIPVAERVSGKQLSFAKLTRVIERAKECAGLWLQVIQKGKHRPAPLTAFDQFINMAPVVDLRGEEDANTFYRTLLAELDQRIASGVGAVKSERKRVLWDNLPVWPRIRQLSKSLARHDVNVVASTYTNAWGELAPMIDPARPLASLARTYLHPILNRSTAHKLKLMSAMAKEYEIDGVILHSDRSCKPYSLGQIDQRDRIVNELGIPALLLEADHNDPRSYSDQQMTTRLDAFVEMMDG